MPKPEAWVSAITSIDALLKTAELFSITEYAKNINKSREYVRQKRNQAFRMLRENCLYDYMKATPDHVYRAIIEKYSEVDFEKKLEEFIRAQDTKLWSTVPHKAELPTPYEIIAYLLDFYRDEFLSSIILVNKFLPNYEYFNYNEAVKMYESKWSLLLPYRVRKYDFCDRIIEQNDYSDKEFRDANVSKITGDGVHRIVILKKSLFADEWNIISISNNKKDFSHICTDINAEWKITYYDYEDNVIKSDILTEYLDCDEFMITAQQLNAMYFVSSHREPGSNGDFSIQYNGVNYYCKSSAAARAIEDYILKSRFEETSGKL